jgi:hypothetical protein
MTRDQIIFWNIRNSLGCACAELRPDDYDLLLERVRAHVTAAISDRRERKERDKPEGGAR